MISYVKSKYVVMEEPMFCNLSIETCVMLEINKIIDNYTTLSDNNLDLLKYDIERYLKSLFSHSQKIRNNIASPFFYIQDDGIKYVPIINIVTEIAVFNGKLYVTFREK